MVSGKTSWILFALLDPILTPGIKNLWIWQTLHPCLTSNLSHGKRKQKCAGMQINIGKSLGIRTIYD